MRLIGTPAVKKYTAFEIIRLVQRTVSDEICGLSEGEVATAYEIERIIVAELVKEGGCETNV